MKARRVEPTEAVSTVFVVNSRQDWPIEIPGTTIVSARAYLTDPAYGNGGPLTVFNLCKFSRYQGLGYYVSLLGEARGHSPLPQVKAIRDIQSDTLVRVVTEEIDDLLQQTLTAHPGPSFDLNIYFGRDPERVHDALAQQLFNLLPVPLLQARLERRDDQWHVQSMLSLSVKDVPAQHHSFIVSAVTDFIAAGARRARRRKRPPYYLAILHNPTDREPPSNPEALTKFQQAASALDLQCEMITKSDWGRLAEFDGLFIRETTYVNHHTYRFSRRAAAEGLVVIDDPDSILRCTNKVYLAELLTRHKIPTPKTMVVHRDNVDQIIPSLGLPCVLKQPDSAFSLGVVKVATEQELFENAQRFLDKSELIIAQEWLMTDFDWRIGVLDHRPLFACKYFMASGHWQIIKRQQERKLSEGATAAVSLAHVPDLVVETAVKASNLIGNGLYGVDLKQTANGCCVIEINDNPNIDAGHEDDAEHQDLYTSIITTFLKRIEARKQEQGLLQ